MELTLIPVDTFRRAPAEGVGVIKTFMAEIKDVPDTERTLDFTISTGAVDRDNDTVDPKGWVVENYLKNPVVLFAHDYHSLPIGRAISLTQTDGALKSRVEFTSKDLNPMGDTVYRMLKGGFLKATSVGFKPIDYKSSKDDSRPYGLDFSKQELLEYSIVPVPSNPEALIGASAAGIDIKHLGEWALGVLKDIGDPDTKAKLLALAAGIEKVADDEKVADAERKAADDKAAADKIEADKAAAIADAAAKQLQAENDAKAAKEAADKAVFDKAVEEAVARLRAKETAPKDGVEKDISPEQAEKIVNAAVDAWELKNRGKLPENF